MAKNEKRVSINIMDKVMKENFQNTLLDTWYGTEIKITKSISFTDMLSFVSDVVNSCFQDDGGFMPEVMDFAIKSNILNRYTNVSMPDNLEHRYELIYCTDVIDFVCQRISAGQLQEIISSVSKKLDYMSDSNVIGIKKKTEELISAFENMQKQTENMFSNVTPDDFSKLIGAIGDGKFSEDKVVEAYLNRTRKAETDTGEE